MYQMLSLFIGFLISIMLTMNGALSAQYGSYFATIVIHFVGLAIITGILFFKKQSPFKVKFAPYLCLGGVIGVFTTVANNLAFNVISVSSITALTLLAQCLGGIIVDHFGLLGMPKHKFNTRKIYGIVLILVGIIAMFNTFDLLAVILSFLAGLSILSSRILNAKLSEKTSLYISTFYNYFMGFLTSIIVFFLLGGTEPIWAGATFSWNAFMYMGGMLGVGVIALSSVASFKVSSFYLSLFLFIGQIGTSIVIDAVFFFSFTFINLLGGILVALGLCVNLIVDKKY